MAVVVTNTGGSPCALNGYPAVSMRDASGAAIASLSQVDAGGQAATATPAAVSVVPGGTAQFIVEVTDISATGSCPEAASANVELPNSAGTVTVTFAAGFAPCPPTFNVGALTK
jgi:hypothetical protein